MVSRTSRAEGVAGVSKDSEGMQGGNKLPSDRLSKEKAKFFKRSIKERGRCRSTPSGARPGGTLGHAGRDRGTDESRAPARQARGEESRSGVDAGGDSGSGGGTPAEDRSSSSTASSVGPAASGDLRLLFDGLSHLYTPDFRKKRPPPELPKKRPGGAVETDMAVDQVEGTGESPRGASPVAPSIGASSEVESSPRLSRGAEVASRQPGGRGKRRCGTSKSHHPNCHFYTLCILPLSF